MRLTVTEYWDQQLAALRKRSVYPAHGTQAIRADRAGDPHKGIIDTTLLFPEEARLEVYERIEINEVGVVHRTQYSYHLRIAGEGVVRTDFDPDLPEDLSYHIQHPGGSGGWTHEPTERITLVSFVDTLCWDYVSTYYDEE